jgi:hypothetical protein
VEDICIDVDTEEEKPALSARFDTIPVQGAPPGWELALRAPRAPARASSLEENPAEPQIEE